MSAPWPIHKLSDVCDVSARQSPRKGNTGRGTGCGGGINSSYSHNVANRPPNIITVSGSGANAGFVNFWTVPIFASDCSTILPHNPDELDVRFVYYAMLNLQDYISQELRRGGSPATCLHKRSCHVRNPCAAIGRTETNRGNS